MASDTWVQWSDLNKWQQRFVRGEKYEMVMFNRSFAKYEYTIGADGMPEMMRPKRKRAEQHGEHNT